MKEFPQQNLDQAALVNRGSLGFLGLFALFTALSAFGAYELGTGKHEGPLLTLLSTSMFFAPIAVVLFVFSNLPRGREY